MHPLLLPLLLSLVGGGAPPAAATARPPWGPCPWAGARPAGYDLDCATVPVPLNYARPDGEWIGHHVTRLRPRGPNPPIAQLWALNGGPGTPGEWLMQYEAARIRNGRDLPFEMLLPDHRGTGLSSELACPDGSQDLTPACVAAVAADPRVRHFTISNAARDLNVSIAALRGSLPVFVLGTSYGTLHLNRFLALFPHAPLAGVVLDSLVDPTFPHFYLYDVEAARVGDEFLRRVSATPDCATLWKGQPVDSLAQDLIRNVGAGTDRCVARHFPRLSGQAGAKLLRHHVFFGSMFQASAYYTRLVLPAVVYRLRRCQPPDVQALATYFAQIPELNGQPSPLPPGLPPFVRQSMVLNALIHLSENFRAGPIPSPEALAALEANVSFSTEAPIRVAELYRQGFPTYPTDQYYGVLSDPAFPVLVFNGDLDAATLVQYTAKLVARRPRWYFQPLPNVGHSPSGLGGAGVLCVQRTLLAFLSRPDRDPFQYHYCEEELPAELPCQANTQRGAELARAAFNTSSLYGVDSAVA